MANLSGSVSKSGHDAWQFYDHPSCVHSHGDVFLFDHLKDVTGTSQGEITGKVGLAPQTDQVFSVIDGSNW